MIDDNLDENSIRSAVEFAIGHLSGRDKQSLQLRWESFYLENGREPADFVGCITEYIADYGLEPIGYETTEKNIAELSFYDFLDLMF